MERRTFLTSMAAGCGLLGTASATPGDGTASPPSEIEILTDEYGEPHVYADDLYSLAYGNGYVQAGDRLFLMDVVRHIGRGDSASVLGPAQLASDMQVRRDLYGPEEISRQWESASETIRTALRGYADGVNRRIVELAGTGELPAEFAALGHAPEPWTPEDSVAAINYLIGYFGVSGGDELANAKTYQKLVEKLDSEDGVPDPERAAHEAYGDLNWLRTDDEHYTTIPDDDLTVEGGETVPDFDEVPQTQLGFTEAAPGAEMWGVEADIAVPDDVTEGRREPQGLLSEFKWGSNALVVDGDLSETGEPLLGGGPQMGFFKPPIPYEIGLHGAGYDVTGIGVVGAPAVVIGRTAGGDDGEALAWTVTSGRDDMVDTIAVELHRDDRHRYRWDGEWHEMETETVTHVASPVPPALGGDPKTRVVVQEVARIEQEGDSMPVVAWNSEKNVAWCQRVTTRFDELTGAFMWAELGRADDLDAFERGLAEFPFTFNFHVVSESGDVAYYHTGKVPERGGGLDHRLPATSERHRWTETKVGLGLGTYDRNPSRGYYANWNNGPAAGWRAGDGEQNWGAIHRVQTLDHFVREHLGVSASVPDGRAVKRAASERLSVADVETLVSQAALHDASAQHVIPHLVDATRGADDDQLLAMADALAAWLDDFCPWHDEETSGDGSYAPPTDGDDRYVHPGHAVFDAVRKRLQEQLFGGVLPPLDFDPAVARHAAPHGTVWDDVTFYDALRGEMAHDWFEDAGGSRDEVVREAMRDAADALAEEFGSDDPADWFAPVHESHFLSIGAGEQEVIDMRNRASYNQAISIGLAQSADAETWQANAGDVLPPGNSGHISGPELLAAQATGEEPARLSDQLDLYVTNEYKPHPATRAQVEAVAVSRQTLRAAPTSASVAAEPDADVSLDAVSGLLEATGADGATGGQVEDDESPTGAEDPPTGADEPAVGDDALSGGDSTGGGDATSGTAPGDALGDGS